jgi:hypothetical protein
MNDRRTLRTGIYEFTGRFLSTRSCVFKLPEDATIIRISVRGYPGLTLFIRTDTLGMYATHMGGMSNQDFERHCKNAKCEFDALGGIDGFLALPVRTIFTTGYDEVPERDAYVQ